MAIPDHYDVLCVGRLASTDDVKKAFRKAALKHHPDKGGDAETFKEINAAWVTLGDEEKRRAYDRELAKSTTKSLGSRTRDFSERSYSANYDSSASASTAASRNASKTRTSAAPQPRQPSPPPTSQANVKIPDDLNALTVKELKELMTALNMRHDDCVEKSDLITRIGLGKKPPPQNPKGKENTANQNIPNTRFPNSSVRIKVITVGAAGIGKSCLVKRYCEGKFVNRYITTIGVDYGVKVVANVHNHACKVNFFDLSGQPEFSEIRTEFYKDAQGVLVCYDSTDAHTFRNLPQWMFESRMHGLDFENENVIAALCATKSDLPGRQVPHNEGAAFAQKHGMLFFATSAQSGENVNAALTSVFEQVVAAQLKARSKLGL